MSESWMPSEEEIAGILEVWGHEAARPIARLIERAALKAQIDELYEWGEHKPAHKQWARVPSRSCPLCIHIEWLRARLAELER